MTDLILLFLTTDVAALLVLGCFGSFLPQAAAGFAAVGLSGLGCLICLPPLLLPVPTVVWQLPFGPPGLPLHLALDVLTTYFLLVIFGCGTAVAAFLAASGGAIRQIQTVVLCLVGLSLTILAADAVTMTLGLALAGAVMGRPLVFPSLTGTVTGTLTGRPTPSARMAAGVLLLLALCLLAPPGFAPRFDTIRAAPVEAGRATAAAALALLGSLALLSRLASDEPWPRAALTSGAVIPTAVYLLVRLLLDLPGQTAQAGWGFVLLLVGSTLSVVWGWQAASHPELDGAVACLNRRQMSLALIGLGLALIARSADLPDSASFALAASLLLMLVSGSAGTLAELAAQAMIQSTAASRIARMGGLLRAMPVASAALVAALAALSALPATAGFAAVWLLYQSVMEAPRGAGLISQLPLALTAAALALTAALGTAASVRLSGIVALSRPRSVRGSAASDVAPGVRPILLGLGVLSVLIGILPGPFLRALADPAIRRLAGIDLAGHAGWMKLSATASASGYTPLPLALLLLMATALVALITRRVRKEPRITAIWSDGVAPSPSLPFGDPAAQSAGAGFLPRLPYIGLQLPPAPFRSAMRLTISAFGRGLSTQPVLGLWLMLAAIGVLLLVIALLNVGSPPA